MTKTADFHDLSQSQHNGIWALGDGMDREGRKERAGNEGLRVCGEGSILAPKSLY